MGVGGKGSVSVTYYDQVASDLIEGVTLNADTSPIVQQFQNLGRVRNQGFEFRGQLQAAHWPAVGAIRDHRQPRGISRSEHTAAT